MNIVYASNPAFDQSVRHITYSGMETLCGKYAAADPKPEGLPVNCEECKSANTWIIGRRPAAFRVVEA